MARRYYGSRIDRHGRSEEAREVMASREQYSGYENSKMIMKEDSGMIHEDRSARANLPRQVIEKEFAPAYEYMPGAPMDLYSGVQSRIKENHSDLKKIFKASK